MNFDRDFPIPNSAAISLLGRPETTHGRSSRSLAVSNLSRLFKAVSLMFSRAAQPVAVESDMKASRRS